MYLYRREWYVECRNWDLASIMSVGEELQSLPQFAVHENEMSRLSLWSDLMFRNTVRVVKEKFVVVGLLLEYHKQHNCSPYHEI